VALAVSGPAQRWLSPGELVGRHATVVKKCTGCHDALFGSPDMNCERCHKSIARNRLRRHGAHAGMIGPCIGCHFMHKRRWQAATVVDPAGVDHRVTRFSLTAHEKQSCADCHARRYRRFSRAASRRCVICHQRLGQKRARGRKLFGAAWKGAPDGNLFARHRRAVGFNCLRCHKGGKHAIYKHAAAKRFFTGKHARTGCVTCHRNDNYSLKSRACTNCHKGGHGVEFNSGCRRCHSFNSWRPALPQHAGKLAGAHPKLKCAACHRENKFSGRTWACTSCHPNRHGPGVEDDCLRCHNQDKWKPAKMDHAAVKAECTGCHPNKHTAGYSSNCRTCHSVSRWKPASMNHAGVTVDCTVCHQRPAGHNSGSCRLCHSVRAWKPASAGHGIRLGGVHVRLGCGSCHAGGRYTGLSWACSSCHRSSHSGYGTNCGSCHNQSAWRPASFSHAGTSGDCSACHTAPGGHYGGSCRQCHQTPGSWSATLANHPRAGDHTYRSFPCSYCHPSGYSSATCTRCHKSGAPGGD